MNQIFYVYIYKYPDTLLPFYVGKGKGNRHKTHLQLFKSDTNELKKNVIRKIFSNKQIPVIDFYITGVSEEMAITVEKALISLYGRRDNQTGILCNMTNGGEGTLNIFNIKRSDEQKQQISERRKTSIWVYNQTTRIEKQINKEDDIPDGFCIGRTPNMISGEKNPMYGKERTIEWKESHAAWHKEHGKKGEDHPLHGKSRSEEDKAKMRDGVKKSYDCGRKVNCAKEITINGVTYNSLKKASIATNMSLRRIRSLIPK